MRDEGIIVALIMIVGLFSFLFASIEAIENGKCAHKNIASYFPPYWITCELLEERWK